MPYKNGIWYDDEVVDPEYDDVPSEPVDEDAGSGKCADCGHKFNKFSSTDFTGKLCNDCFAKTGMSYGQEGGWKPPFKSRDT